MNSGRVARIEKVENDVSHQLIEEYMLLANEAVAARLMSRNRPAIYRVHEAPDERRLQEYREEVLSHHIPCGNLHASARSSEASAEARHACHRPGAQDRFPALAHAGALRRRAARPLRPGQNEIHALHFAHPPLCRPRRASRAVSEAATARRTALKETADHISDTERNSADAERDSKDVKLFAFLKAQLASGNPQRYPALVTDVRNFGFFVDVPGLAMSGLVPLSTMADDFYVFDPQRNHLIGRRTRRVIRLGDKVEVQVAKVDSFKKQVDFRLAAAANRQQQRPPQLRARPSGAGRRHEPRTSGRTRPQFRHSR